MDLNAPRMEAGLAERSGGETGSPAIDFFDPCFLIGLQREIGGSSLERLLRICLEDLELRLGRLQEEAIEGDTKAVRATAHQLLGIFGHVGAIAGAKAAQGVLDSPVDALPECAGTLREVGWMSVAALREFASGGDAH